MMKDECAGRPRTFIIHHSSFIICAAILASAAASRAADKTPPRPAAPAAAAPALDGTIPAAEKLLACTVTVRIAASKTKAAVQQAATDNDGVQVCSGASLGEGLVVTFHRATPDDRIRVTWPGGDQDEARPVVVDEFSSLALLEVDRKATPGLELATAAAKVGGAVLTGAASGIEKPVISLGILGGVERSLPGSGLPLLLQCDLRTTDASSGAAVVDGQGKLLGIVAAKVAAGDSDGWTYAVPVAHVRRLVEARVAGQFTLLRRLRPAMGLTMGPSAEEGTVRVERVIAGGPAEKAGIRVGDLILQTDGRKVRSAYQAVDLVLKKQPGDEVRLVVQQDGVPKEVKLVLEGAAANLDQTSTNQMRLGQKLNVRAVGRNQVEVQQGSRVVELAVDPNAPAPQANVAANAAQNVGQRRVPLDELGMLRTQLAAFEQVIQRLQAELQRRNEREQETDALVKSLTEEVARLRREREAAAKK
ncbi:MAG: serine protease [Planctomycetia bacterium]|nr:serine protease [Planctomycetia bacterium]